MTLLRETLRGSEFEHDVYLAGGAVRDGILNMPVKDLDFVVANHGLTGGIDCAAFIAQKLGNFKQDSNPVIFPTYGTAKLVLPNGMDVEFVAPRKEKYVSESRKPEVFEGTLYDDAVRRDFTMNALFTRLSDNQLLDLTGQGQVDLGNGVIRTTSDATWIFSEDPLRMIRAVRFAVKYGFDIPFSLLRAIKVNAYRLQVVSHERIQDELNKILVLDKPSRAIRLFLITGLLAEFAPEVQALVGVTQNAYHNRDAFGHTMDVLDAARPTKMVRLAALFHDIGKAQTRTEKDGKVHFIGHEMVGVGITREVMKRLKYSNDEVEAVTGMVRHHMELKPFKGDLSGMRDKNLRKFLFRVGVSQLEPTLDLIHADNLCHAPGHTMPHQVDLVRERLEGMDLSAIENTTSLLDGNELMAMGAQGRLIQQVKNRIVELMLEQPNFTKQAAVGVAKTLIANAAKAGGR